MTEEEIKVLTEEAARLKAENAELAGKVAARDAKVAEMEQLVSSRDNEMTVLQQNMTEVKARLEGMSADFQNAISGYRAVTASANPDIPVEMITGENIGAIDEAVASARSLIGKVKEQMEKNREQVRVPPGAPQRMPVDLSGLSPRGKIQYGVANTNPR